MGFAASQARFLSLTSRLSDKEYEAQQISQERLALTNQMALYADEYEAATVNQAIFANVYNMNTNEESTVVLSYDVITKPVLEGGLGMSLVTSSGLFVVPNKEEMARMIESSRETDDEPLTMADFYVFEEINDTSVLQKNLEDGNMYFVGAKNPDTGAYDKKGIGVLNNVTTNYDKSDDAAAKAKYDKRMNKAEALDAMLEMRLDKIETEHKALETEMDAVQKVVDDNVENSFKTFG